MGDDFPFEEVLQRRLKDYTKSDDNTVSGYVEEENYDSLIQELHGKGFSYSVRKSHKNAGETIWFSYKGKQTFPEIKFCGSTFRFVRTSFFQCSRGPKYYKVKERCVQDPSALKRKKRAPRKFVKKIGCPAWMTVKCVQIFEEYSAPNSSRRSKLQAIKKLKEALQSPTPPQGCIRYYFKASIGHSHSPMTTEETENEYIGFDEGFDLQVVEIETLPSDIDENPEHLGVTLEEAINSIVVQTSKEDIKRLQEDLREKAKLLIEMSYNCDNQSALDAAIDALNFHCVEMAKSVPVSIRVHLTPSDSEGYSKKIYNPQTPRRKRKNNGSVLIKEQG